ncbi:MAG: biotin/lipoyl-containing protein [bacterium]
MAHEVLLPKQGNSVESCIIIEWSVDVGDTITEGQKLCEVETDKATFEVESTATGTVLKLLYEAGDEAPVMQPIAIVGEEGEQVDVSSLAAAAGDMRQDRFDMPMTIPGAHLFATLRVHPLDDDAFLAEILGPAMRDDTLDPVATSGNFLAQAMPGYVDLDLLFRQHRERLVAQAGREG